jgi:plastocyanin
MEESGMHKAASAAMAFAAALAIAGCGGGGGGSSAPTSPTSGGSGSGGSGGTGGIQTTVTITISGSSGRTAFNPNPADVAAGQLVVFKNNDVVAHHIMLDDGTLQTADIAPGGTSAAVAMGTSGSKTYHCTIHPAMVGGFNGSQGVDPPDCSQQYCGG